MPGLTTLSLKSYSKRKLLLCFCLFLFSSIRIFGQAHSFSGSIGKYPVYIQFTLEGTKVEGYYFYKNKLIDIYFSGTYKAGLITFKTTDALGDEIENPETFKFKWPNKAPVGTWTNKGKTSELKLLPLTVKETSSPKWNNSYLVQQMSEISNLQKVKIGLFKLKEDGQPRIINRVKVRYFTEVHSELTFFRIDSGLVANKLNDMNSYLEYFHVSEFLGSLDCGSYSSYGTDYGFDVSNITISNDLICFSVFATFYCGGAHPDEVNYGVNFNLSTHKAIASDDYLLAGKNELFQEQVISYLSKTNPGYFDSEMSEDDMGCEYNSPELWTTDCSFTFTDEGLKLHPSFAHYKAPCLDPEWAVVPYSELKDLIKPEYYSKLIKLKP